MRWIGGIAIHWFYRDIRVTGTERVPIRGPVLIAMNHQNAMVDAILAHEVVPRELRMTAKATLANGLLGKLLFASLGIIPLRRAADEGVAGSPARNRSAFGAIIEELRNGGAILMFPEGKSHNDPVVAPLKTGLARAAIWAREAEVHGIQIVPVGITFENKAEPGTAVVVQVGEVIDVDSWRSDDSRALTEAIAERLRAVSLTATIPELAPTPQRNPVVRAFAWWGNLVHRIPVNLARRLAIHQSDDEGEPAMYTMSFGLGLILVSYILQVTIAWLLTNVFVALAYLGLLIAGAYWAAYAGVSRSNTTLAA